MKLYIVYFFQALEKAQMLAGQPMIMSRAKSYKDAQGRSVHDRLYIQGKELLTEKHNSNVELLSSKLNLPLRPWEGAREIGSAASWTLDKSHLPKNNKGPDDYLWSASASDQSPPLCVVDFDDSIVSVWKFLRKNELLNPVEDNCAVNI
jgi:hypothetical protein